MHRRFNSNLLLFDPEIKKTLLRRKKVKADKVEMEDPDTDKFSGGHLDQNEMLGIWEPTLGDCWRPMMNEEY